MTPTASRLKTRLDDRRQWFHGWFFKWHHIGGDREVQIDTFDGGSVPLCGISFEGTTRDYYWDLVVRGVRREIEAQLEWVDQEVRRYNRATALESIDQCAGLLASFASSVRRGAIKKDRILRGNGIQFPPENDAGRWIGTSLSEIQAQADAIKLALPDALSAVPTKRQRMLTVWNENQWWLGPLAFALGIAGFAIPFLI